MTQLVEHLRCQVLHVRAAVEEQGLAQSGRQPLAVGHTDPVSPPGEDGGDLATRLIAT
jgi:hypothetical protein